jgi:hypothetical protein
MRLQRFNDGDLVTLKFDMPWKVIAGPELITEFPEYGKVYTIGEYTDYIHGKGWFLVLKELSREIEFAEVDFSCVAVRVRAMQEREFILNLN